MSRLPVPGQDADIWGDVLNDFLSVAHQTDGSLKPGIATVADGSITPAKLSVAYVPVTDKAASNGVATLDGTGKVPVGQLPPGAVAGDATATAKGILQLTGDLGGTAASPTVPGLAAKANDAAVVHLANAETISGKKTFSLAPDVPAPSGAGDAANKSYVDTSIASAAAPAATTSTKGIIQLAGDLSGTATAPTVPALANKVSTSQLGVANGVATLDGTGKVPVAQLPTDADPDATTSSKGIVQLAGDLGGTAAAPTVPALANKVSTSQLGVANGVATLDSSGLVPVSQLPADIEPDATTSAKGLIQLAGDLAGTATAPTVPALAGKVNTSTTITAGTGLTGGGDLSANRTLTVSYGTTAGTAAQGNDSRITGAEQTTNKGVANGYASLDATGKVPGSQIPAYSDATTSAKGIVQLAGDLGGTAAAPTVPALANKVNTSQLGAAGGVATLNASGLLTATQAPPQVLPYSMSSALSVTTGAIRLYNYSGAAWTIVGVSAAVGTAPTGASIIVDVKINGTTIFTTQANRPTIAAGSNASGHVTNMDVTSVPNGSYLTVDVAQVGSTVAGSDLCVQVEVH